MSETTAFMIMIVSLIIGAVIVLTSIKECTLEEQKMYLEKGYCKLTIDGVQRWSKCKE